MSAAELGVTPWMRTSGASTRDAGDRLTRLASDLDEVGRTLSGTLGAAVTALGWEGQITDRAREAAGPGATLVRRLADACEAAGRALRDLAAILAWRGPALDRLVTRHAELRSGDFTMDVPGDGGQEITVTDYAAYLAAREHLEQQIFAHRDPLAEADRTCRDALARVEDDVTALVPPGTSPGFLRSLVPAEVWGHFSEVGVADTAQEAAIADQITAATTAAELRELLRHLPVQRLQNFLARHPVALAILADDHLPRNPSDPTLSGLWEVIGPVSDDGQVVDIASIASIRDYWAGLGPQEQLRLRLLHPTLIGNLDGIPVEHRAAANRLLIRSAVDQERARLAVLEQLPDNATTLEALKGRLPGSALQRYVGGKLLEGLFSDSAQGLIADLRLRDQELGRSRSRIELYTALLTPVPSLRAADVADPAGTVLRSDERAVLLFDPRGDGRFAEWHGALDADNVGIFVPGTTTDLASIGSYALRMEVLAGGRTATVTWMGIDLPDAVASDATQTRYSAEGGAALLRFIEGLDVTDRTVTAVGHSAGGGIVGYADVLGMRVDRTFLIAPSGSGLGIRTPLPWPLGPWGGEPVTPTEYPATDWTQDAERHVQRYTMTAPGDSIWVAQRSEDARFWIGIPDDWGHGLDPNRHDQFIRLETGRFTGGPRDGQRLEGLEAHSWVVQEDTDAWSNILGVIEGGEVIPYLQERTWWGRRRSVYDDDGHAGTDPVPIDSLPGGGE
jgi:hypothetical protein